MVEMRKLGQTDIEVSPVGLGVMEFAGGKWPFSAVFPPIAQEHKNAIIKASLDGGINWFDTAELYGYGQSEQSLAEALKAGGIQPGGVVIATKWFPFLRRAPNILRNVKTRLRYLGGYPIDLFYVHQPFGLSSPEAEMDAMAELVQTGQIRSVGVSNFNVERMQRAHETLEKHGLPLAANQMEYSLLNRRIETNGVIKAAKNLGVTIVAYTPLASGVLSGKYHRDPELLKKTGSYRRRSFPRMVEESRPLIEAMQQMAEKHNASVAQVALNWVINFQGETVTTIPGATKVSQAEQNAGAMGFTLSPEDLDTLDRLSRKFL